MSTTNSPLSPFKKSNPSKISFGIEITVAVLVKFLLLWGLWGLFFAGHKQPVNDVIIADKIFNTTPFILAPKQNKEH